MFAYCRRRLQIEQCQRIAVVRVAVGIECHSEAVARCGRTTYRQLELERAWNTGRVGRDADRDGIALAGNDAAGAERITLYVIKGIPWAEPLAASNTSLTGMAFWMLAWVSAFAAAS